MKKLLLVLFLSAVAVPAICQSTNTVSSSDQAIVSNLLNNLTSDPDNPLKINKEHLQEIAISLPDGSLKTVLLSHSANLGTDKNLSMRQVYYDLNAAFTTHGELNTLAHFESTEKGLDMLLNNSTSLIETIQAGAANYKPGVFMNDPYFISDLQQTLQISDHAAFGLGVGVDLALAILADYKMVKQFREDYTQYAEMSSQMVYPEADEALSKALIDACVGRNPLNMISPLYRYDFDNGASIRVENGILRYINHEKKIYKNLIPVENRNDGTSYETLFSGTFFDTQDYQPQVISVGLTDDNFLIQTGKIEKENPCNDCLKRFELYTVNSENGKADEFKYKYIIRHDNILSTRLIGDSIKTVWRYKKTMYDYSFNAYTNKLVHTVFPIGDKKFANGLKLQGLEGKEANYISSTHRFNYSFVKDGGMVSIYWGLTKNGNEMVASSVLDIGFPKKSSHTNIDAMLNELTGLSMSSKGILYFTTASGQIGSVDLNTTALTDVKLTDKMRQSLVKSDLEKYSFRFEKTYLFQSTEYANYYNLPSLTLTPDEKHLVYVVGNKLHIIDTSKLEESKKFTMTIDPFMHFYAKENGEPTIYFQAFNEFKFPVTKKYSLNKLIAAKVEAPIARKQQAVSPQASPSPAGSVADELIKLKTLLDQGAISKEEYELAKKNVLGN